MLKRASGVWRPLGYPNAPWANAVLQSQTEVDVAIEQVRSLGLPVFEDRPKNWDSLAALDLILRNTRRGAHVFDAGGELYSMILPWLFLYGYTNLVAGNLAFTRKYRRGPITYEKADITRTTYRASSVDAVSCLSVIEHGVELDAYFREMSRILKPGGLLITSTDYYETPVDTNGHSAYGVPIHVWTKNEIEAGIEMAETHGLVLTSPLDLRSSDKVVHWPEYDLRYTFLNLSMRKLW